MRAAARLSSLSSESFLVWTRLWVPGGMLNPMRPMMGLRAGSRYGPSPMYVCLLDLYGLSRIYIIISKMSCL